MKNLKKALIASAATAILISPIAARTKLTTLPIRDSLVVDLRNERYNLVEEERTINLQKGRNQIEFAWAGTQIEMSTIQFLPVRTPGKVNVLNVNYPPGETALFWEVWSEKAGPGVFRIAYLIGGLQRTISYEAIADVKERTLDLKSHITIQNATGESFRSAKILSPYEGNLSKTFEISDAKKMLLSKYEKVKITKAYHFDQANYGDNVRFYYELMNDKSGGLGEFPMLPGKVRIYQEDSSGSEAFLGEDWGQYSAMGQKWPLLLGQSKEIKIKRAVFESKEDDTDSPVKNIRETIRYQIENFKNEPVKLTLHEHPDGEWEVESVSLKEERGERDELKETAADGSRIKWEKKDVNNLEIEFTSGTTKNFKYNLYVKWVLKNRF